MFMCLGVSMQEHAPKIHNINKSDHHTAIYRMQRTSFIFVYYDLMLIERLVQSWVFTCGAFMFFGLPENNVVIINQ